MSDTDDEAKTLKQLMGPLKLFLGPLVDVAVQVKKQVDAEQDSKASILRELRVLAAAVDRGDMSEAEFEAREEALLDKLEALEFSEDQTPEDQPPEDQPPDEADA